MEHIVEREKTVPVLARTDVVVAGAGIAGTIAAISAARHQAKTILIDRFGSPGGNMGPGVWAAGTLHLALKDRRFPDESALVNRCGMGGIPEEFIRRAVDSRPIARDIPLEVREELERTHYNLDGYRLGAAGYPMDAVVCTHVAFQMLEEAGVEWLLSAYVCDPVLDGSRVTGVFAETKSGRVAILGKVVVDATGEADVAFRAGAPTVNCKSPGVGLWFSIQGVDRARFLEYLAHDGIDPADIEWANRTLPGAKFAANEAQADEPSQFADVIYMYYDEKVHRNCDVPYRMLLPKGVDGLIAAGRSGMVYGPNLRARYSVMLDAQAAGVAAALCAADGIQPRQLDVRKLQRILWQHGCPLGDRVRLKELGLVG